MLASLLKFSATLAAGGWPNDERMSGLPTVALRFTRTVWPAVSALMAVLTVLAGRRDAVFQAEDR